MKVVTLNIGLTVEVIDTEPISASRKVKLDYRPNLRGEWQLTNSQINDLNSFLTTVVSVIESRGFIMLDKYQSDESYSYYMTFRPRNQYTGEEFEFDVKFRLSDHNLTNAKKSSRSNELPPTVVFRSYVVEGVRYNTIVDTIHAIQNACNKLMVGDYSDLHITSACDSDNTLITL